MTIFRSAASAHQLRYTNAGLGVKAQPAPVRVIKFFRPLSPTRGVVSGAIPARRSSSNRSDTSAAADERNT